MTTQRTPQSKRAGPAIPSDHTARHSWSNTGCAFGIADLTLVLDAAPLLVVAALAAGLLVDLTGFRSMFIVSGVFALAGIALMIRVSRHRPVPTP